MFYKSLKSSSKLVNFEEAVKKGLAEDGGLFFPEKIKKLNKEFIENLEEFSNIEIAYEVIKQFIGDEINENDLKKIISLIEHSSKPVIICGAGVKHSKTHNEAILLSKKLNIPIVSSAGHGDVISSEYKLYSGQMGPRGNKIASSLVKNADLILAIGTRLGR